MPGILEALILPIPSLVIGGVLLFFAIKRIRASSDPEIILAIQDYAKNLGCGGMIGAAFFLIGVLLSMVSFLTILANLF